MFRKIIGSGILRPESGEQIIVTGTLSPDASGVYDYFDDHNDKSRYKQRGGIWYCSYNTLRYILINNIDDFYLGLDWDGPADGSLVGDYEPNGGSTGTATVALVE